MRILLSIPMFAFVMIAANYFMLVGPEDASMLNIIVFEFGLPSGRLVILTISDALILAAILCLYFETFKATRTSNSSIIDHAFSLMVFVVALIEFLTIDRLGNATFLILTLASLMDVVMGFTVTITTARRDFNVG